MPEIEKIREAAAAIRSQMRETPKVGLVLGSGLGGLVEEMEDARYLSYGEIPHWPESAVKGHPGELAICRLGGVPVVAMQGRVHFYEGYDLAAVVRPVRSLALAGCPAFLLTNAAGGVNESFAPGDLMWITDHLNLQGANPLQGANLDDLGPRFPDMSEVYEGGWKAFAETAAKEAGIRLRAGVYAALSGPSYETPAEIRMLRILGADAVGMSTAPEAIALRHAGAKVGAVSLVTNMAAGILGTPLSHEEVTETAERVKCSFQVFITALVREIGGRE